MKRVESLDYLRGIMAASVMLYHYTSSSFGMLGAESLLGKLGTYAVSIFYILSGLSLTIVYKDKIQSVTDIRNFFIKRIFRILPLFSIIITISMSYKCLGSYLKDIPFNISFYDALLSYTLLFGFVAPTTSLATGAWSIGNEMVFYSILPLVFWSQYRNSLVLPLVFFISIAIELYISFILINPNVPLAEQWPLYVNPFNQLFLFMAGVAIGTWGKYVNIILPRNYKWAIAVITLLLFIFWPVSGDRVQIVYGMGRWLFSTLAITFVLMLFILNPILNSWPHRILSFLGQGCYSIYLLHPLIAAPLVFLFPKLGLNELFAYILAFFATFFFSWLTFKHIEEPMMNYGKILTNKFAT